MLRILNPKYLITSYTPFDFTTAFITSSPTQIKRSHSFMVNLFFTSEMQKLLEMNFKVRVRSPNVLVCPGLSVSLLSAIKFALALASPIVGKVVIKLRTLLRRELLYSSLSYHRSVSISVFAQSSDQRSKQVMILSSSPEIFWLLVTPLCNENDVKYSILVIPFFAVLRVVVNLDAASIPDAAHIYPQINACGQPCNSY